MPSLVGSEMCIRDRLYAPGTAAVPGREGRENRKKRGECSNLQPTLPRKATQKPERARFKGRSRAESRSTSTATVLRINTRPSGWWDQRCSTQQQCLVEREWCVANGITGGCTCLVDDWVDGWIFHIRDIKVKSRHSLHVCSSSHFSCYLSCFLFCFFSLR